VYNKQTVDSDVLRLWYFISFQISDVR